MHGRIDRRSRSRIYVMLKRQDRSLGTGSGAGDARKPETPIGGEARMAGRARSSNPNLDLWNTTNWVGRASGKGQDVPVPTYGQKSSPLLGQCRRALENGPG